MAPANEELTIVEAQIYEATTRIQSLKLQLEQAELEQAEIGLQCLREKKAAILETTANHRRALSCFREIPEDVLREICLACMGLDDIPLLTSPALPLPYTLMQISSGIRRIVLSTPSIWASVHIQIISSSRMHKMEYTTLLRDARKWFERAGGLALSLFVEDITCAGKVSVSAACRNPP